MVYGLRELKNKSRDNCEWVTNGDFFLLFDAIIAHRCATMRYDSASPKTGAWPSLTKTSLFKLSKDHWVMALLKEIANKKPIPVII